MRQREKPCLYAFNRCLETVLKRVGKEDGLYPMNESTVKRYFVIVTRDLSQKLELDAILYIQQDLRDVGLYTDTGMVAFRGKVCEVVSGIGGEFVMCHRYLAVNFKRVEKMAGEVIYFDNGFELRIGRTNYYRLRKVFNEYLLALE